MIDLPTQSLDDVIEEYVVLVYLATGCHLRMTSTIVKRNQKTVRFILAKAGRMKTNDKIFTRKKWQQGAA